MKKISLKKRILLPLVALLWTISVMAQEKVTFTAKGVVKDETGAPMVGVPVQLRGTTVGTLSDLDGAYMLTGTVSAGVYEMIATIIGYTTAVQKVDISASSANIAKDFDLSPDALNLNEVLVIGSSVLQERKQLGNASTTIRADDIARAGTGNAIQALQGKISGAQISQNSGDPSGGISVRLRGAKSLAGSSEPLYVIDGIVSNNNTVNLTNANVNAGQAKSALGQNRMADINPNDIETVNVLNGAAAAAIYGSRASNGVVLITTKKGKSGKPKLSFSTAFSMNELRKKSFISTYGKQWHPNAITDPTAAGYINPQLSTLYPVAKGGSIAPADSITVWANLIDVKRYDYQDEIFRQSNGTDNNLTLSGGSETTSYYASLNFLKNEGIIKNTDFQRVSGRVRIDHQLNSWLNMSTGLMYANSFSNELPNGNVFFSPTNSINITNNIYDLNALDAAGNYQAVERLSRINPLSIVNGTKNSQSTNRTMANLQLTAHPIEGLTVAYTLGVDNTNQLGRNYSPIFPYPVNLSYYDKGYAANNTALTNLINHDLVATYAKNFGIFSTSTVVGYNYQSSREQISFTEGRDLAPFVTTVSGASTPLPSQFADVTGIVQGAFIQETVGLNDRFFVTAAIRGDESSRFPTDTRRNFYPKLSASYMLSNEPFFENLKHTISQLRLRASWGQSGNLTGFGAFDRFNRFAPTAFGGKSAINAQSAIADPNVKVERNTEIEAGAEVSFFKDFVNIGFSAYRQTATDLLLNVTTAPSQGGSTIKTNVGTLENKGVELTFGITPIKTAKMSVNIFGTYSHNDNKITALPAGLTSITNPAGAPVFVILGAPVGVFYGNFYARDANGAILNRNIKVNGVPTPLPQVERGPQQKSPLSYTAYREANGQPVITGANGIPQRKIIGNPNPRNIWSAGLNANYGNLRIHGLLDALSGVEVWNADKRTRNNVGIGEVSEKELKGELPRGSVAALGIIDEFRVDDGSFIKLRELGVSYSLGNIVKGISNLEISLMGRNLYSWDNYFGYDPETNSGGQSSISRGIDFGNSPIPRTYTVALKANF
ncbi:MAG: SusC/RagA family TonB-linked outer membrane protein [Saprospiraceae bacterium]|nr:SusC/RagA family TonB-linked outer membrane protein [Saprospiraceae bacterium]